jgi:uroporphyrinogen-III synthase
MTAPLDGRTVVVTREHEDHLGEALRGLGARVVHVPMIHAVDPVDGGAALRGALEGLDGYDWLVVTSPNGARRISVTPMAATQIAVVGRATADALAASTGRTADLVPEVQRLDGLLAVFPTGDGRVLAVRGDRADPALIVGLEARGWQVDDVVAYRTVSRRPTADDRRRIEGAAAVVFASGSAATSWSEAFADGTPADVISIGPSTTVVARSAGLPVTAEADEHSIEGLVAAVVRALTG